MSHVNWNGQAHRARVVIVASLMAGVNTVIEHDVKAQNMTTNMTGGNSTGTNDSSSGSISSLAPAPPE